MKDQLNYDFRRDWDYSKIPFEPINCTIKFFTQDIVDDINQQFNTNYMIKELYHVTNETFHMLHDYISNTKKYIGVWC